MRPHVVSRIETPIVWDINEFLLKSYVYFQKQILKQQFLLSEQKTGSRKDISF